MSCGQRVLFTICSPQPQAIQHVESERAGRAGRTTLAHMSLDDMFGGDQPHCPDCNVIMRDDPGGWRCPECGHFEPAMSGPLPEPFEGPSIQGG